MSPTRSIKSGKKKEIIKLGGFRGRLFVYFFIYASSIKHEPINATIISALTNYA